MTLEAMDKWKLRALEALRSKLAALLTAYQGGNDGYSLLLCEYDAVMKLRRGIVRRAERRARRAKR